MTNDSRLNARKFVPWLIVAAGLLAYSNSFTGSFFHDDFGSILENPTIRQLWPIWQPLSPPHLNWLTVEGRPLINLSLAINYALGGYNVWGYHALNLVVHILAGLTLLGIMRRTLLQPPLRERFGAAANELALVVALLWTVHPLQTESVTYIIQRAESVMGLFYLLTLYCFIRGVESQRTRLWYGLCIGACALGMASKEVMVSAPVMVLLYDRAFVTGSFREAWRRRWPLYLGLAGTWVVLGFVEISAGISGYAAAMTQRVDRWEYLANQPGVILYYLRLCVWPSPLRLDRAWPLVESGTSILLTTATVGVLLAATVWAWKRKPAWGFVGAWFFLILAPSSSFIPIPSLIHEHRMYLSLAAVVSVAVMGLYSMAGRRSLTVLVLLVIGFGFLTWRRNQDYRSELTVRFGTDTEAYKNPLVQYNAGVAYGRQARFQEAIDHYEQALRLKPDFPEAHNNLGSILFQMGNVTEAMTHYKEAVRLKPDYAGAHYNLGVALEQAGRVAEAKQHYEQSLRLQPGFVEAQQKLARLRTVP
jgi:protein O-mannosyl-transferase